MSALFSQVALSWLAKSINIIQLTSTQCTGCLSGVKCAHSLSLTCMSTYLSHGQLLGTAHDMDTLVHNTDTAQRVGISFHFHINLWAWHLLLLAKLQLHLSTTQSRNNKQTCFRLSKLANSLLLCVMSQKLDMEGKLIRNSDVVFDSNFSFDQYISQVCTSCFYHICDFCRIRRHLYLSSDKTISVALINSRPDYCNSL